MLERFQQVRKLIDELFHPDVVGDGFGLYFGIVEGGEDEENIVDRVAIRGSMVGRESVMLSLMCHHLTDFHFTCCPKCKVDRPADGDDDFFKAMLGMHYEALSMIPGVTVDDEVEHDDNSKLH